jgi:hypothetical protein
LAAGLTILQAEPASRVGLIQALGLRSSSLVIQFLNLIGQLIYFGFAIYFIIAAWIDKGFGVAVVMLILACVFYAPIAKMFPLPNSNDQSRVRGRRR